jgi:hypothetical protein
MKKTNESWSQYLNNKSVRPKTFNITMRRNSRGEFIVAGGQSLMEVKDGYNSEWVKVNSRSLVKAIAESGIVAL